jgi:DNA-directed RNA polymerase specialized sigma24 family protein
MELVRSAQGIVMGLLVRHVRPQDREDLFQEVFLRIHRHLDTYRGESALSTWVYQVALNVIRAHWADLQRRQVLFLRDVDGCAYEEIAQRLQVPLGTVKSRLARARANLAEAFPAQALQSAGPDAPGGANVRRAP